MIFQSLVLAIVLTLSPVGNAGGDAATRASNSVHIQPTATQPAALSPLFDAVRRGDAARVAALLHAGANPNARDSQKQTALHVAAFSNNVDVARLLINDHADLNAQEGLGETPLHNAARADAVDVARLLLDRGAAVGANNLFGRTPLDVAQGQGSAAVAALLWPAHVRSVALWWTLASALGAGVLLMTFLPLRERPRPPRQAADAAHYSAEPWEPPAFEDPPAVHPFYEPTGDRSSIAAAAAVADHLVGWLFLAAVTTLLALWLQTLLEDRWGRENPSFLLGVMAVPVALGLSLGSLVKPLPGRSRLQAVLAPNFGGAAVAGLLACCWLFREQLGLSESVAASVHRLAEPLGMFGAFVVHGWWTGLRVRRPLRDLITAGLLGGGLALAWFLIRRDGLDVRDLDAAGWVVRVAVVVVFVAGF